MNIIITAKNFELTEGIKSAIHDRLLKVGKMVNAQEVKALLEVKKYGQKIDVIIPVNGVIIKAEGSSEDLYEAIDEVAEKLKSQINKYLKRQNEISKETIRYNGEEYEEDEDSKHRIVKRKSFFLKPMSEEEAMLQMELLGHQVFMFFNSDTDSMCMLYKRKDGEFGIIEAER